MTLGEFISLKELTDKSILLEGKDDPPDSLVKAIHRVEIQIMKSPAGFIYRIEIGIPCYFVCVVNCCHCLASYRFRISKKYQYLKDELGNIFTIHCRNRAQLFHNSHLPLGCGQRDFDDFPCFFDYEKVSPDHLAQFPAIYPRLN